MLRRRVDGSSLKFDATDHVVLRALRGEELRGAKFFAIGVSGGGDSVCLLHILKRLERVLRKPIVVLHVHHGSSASRFRDEAQEFVKALATRLEVGFISNRRAQKNGAASEAELREYRYRYFSKWMKQLESKYDGAGVLLVAQHWDDLLETRLIRLIRGTGAGGFEAMKIQNGSLCRPLLHVSKSDITTYLRVHEIEYVEDPTNAELDPLRNWLRHEWLPALEKKRQGSVYRLAQSLENVSEALRGLGEPELRASTQHISRGELRQMNTSERKAYLAEFLRQRRVKAYTTRHLDEVIKRLDTPKKVFSFSLLKLVWTVNAEQIRVTKSR